jgi:hypothetical protein
MEASSTNKNIKEKYQSIIERLTNQDTNNKITLQDIINDIRKDDCTLQTLLTKYLPAESKNDYTIDKEGNINITKAGREEGDVLFGDILTLQYIYNIFSTNKTSKVNFINGGVGSGKSYFQSKIVPELIKIAINQRIDDEKVKKLLSVRIEPTHDGTYFGLNIESKESFHLPNEKEIVRKYIESKKNTNFPKTKQKSTHTSGTYNITSNDLFSPKTKKVISYFDKQEKTYLQQQKENIENLIIDLAKKAFPFFADVTDDAQKDTIKLTLLKPEERTELCNALLELMPLMEKDGKYLHDMNCVHYNGTDGIWKEENVKIIRTNGTLDVIKNILSLAEGEKIDKLHFEKQGAGYVLNRTVKQNNNQTQPQKNTKQH